MKRIEKLTAEYLGIYLNDELQMYWESNPILPWKLNYNNIGFAVCGQNKPILRTRQSITPEELETFSICFRMWYDKPSFDYNIMVYSDIVTMAKLHIDIFGLIESGLAVDKETIKK